MQDHLLIEAEKAHKGFFSENFSEDCIVRFIDLFSSMLPYTCNIPIDKACILSAC